MATDEPVSAQQAHLNHKPLRVIIVEDSALDAELVERQLTKAGYEVAALRVESAAAFEEALATGDWDVILADYVIPGFGAVPALERLKQSKCDIPFIIVSGAITDEMAVASMRAGAHDYILKNNIARLVPAIERELKEAASRQQKREAEAAVRHLSAIVESSDDAIIGMTLDGTITSWNRGAERLYAYSAAEMLGHSISILIPPHRPNELVEVLQRLACGEHIEQYEAARQRKEGALVDVAVKISPILDSAGNVSGASSIARDITERKRAEQALIRSEKLASVGRMAATIAHEINNPLASAMNAIFLASMDPSVAEPVHKNLELAETELERVAHITKQTLGFYRETGQPTTVNLPDIVDGTLGLYGPKLKNKSVSVHRKFHSTALVRGIEGELRQVISNLVANSLDAVSGNATLQVRTSGPGLRDGLCPMVRLTIADNGTGISPENLKHLFEPFFTTKQAFGTGLGLWVTKELVEKHDGRIRVRSQLGKGTVFSIWLPADRRQQERNENEQVTAKNGSHKE